ncbi:hypothetical protein LC612_10780 [Nostoc sp. CHAB 5834]|nr:hypothetical protein [Nostoc sp. CHAB 5834]
MKDFLRGTIIHSSNYVFFPTTAFYTGENAQPQSCQVDSSINVAVNHQRVLLIPIFSDTARRSMTRYRFAISKNNFIAVTENH